MRATRLPVPEIRLTEEEPDPALHVRIGQTATLGELSGQIQKAKAEGIPVIFCCSEGETADTLLTDLAVAYGADRIDAGPACHMAIWSMWKSTTGFSGSVKSWKRS